jgi:thiol-disulfide isomerase/thioredoxin
MKKSTLLCIVCCMLLTVSRAQTGNIITPNASITLIVKNSPIQMLIVRNSKQSLGYDVIDSAMLGENGGVDSLHFDLSVTGRESHLQLIFRKKNFGRFIPVLAPGDHLKIIADLSKPGDFIFTGSVRTREFYDFYGQCMLIGKDMPKHKIQPGNADSILVKRRIDSINNLTALFLRKTIFNTDCAHIALFALLWSQNGVVTYTKEELNQLREKFKDDNLILMQIDMNENLQDHPRNTKPKPANGTYLADFTLPDMNANQVSLSQFKGKYVLVDFWASWCGPCRIQSPYLKEVSQRFSKNNFVILTISIDENHDDWDKAIIQDGTQAFVNLIDVRGRKSPVKNQYNIDSIPSNFFIDPTGKVIDKDLKGEKLVAKVAEVIQNTGVKN